MKSFAGLNGEVLVEDDYLYLVRKSKIDSVFHKKKKVRLLIRDIDKIIFSKGGLVNGYMVFLKEGEKCPKSIFSALKNENAIIFRMTKNDKAEEFYRLLSRMVK